MRTFKTLVLFFAASLLIVSCKKDKDKVSKTELLTKSAWVMVKYEEKANSGTWQDTFPGFDACSKDDKWIFKSNFSIDLTEGNTACSGNTANQVLDSTTWAFLENETKLQVEQDIFNIDQLDENTLIISYSETSSGVTYYTRVTLSH